MWVSRKNLIFQKNVWFWCPCMLTVMKEVPLQNEIVVQKRSRNTNFFHTMISDWRGTPLFFYDERGPHPKMKLCVKHRLPEPVTWFPYNDFRMGCDRLAMKRGGVTPHPEIIVRDNHLATESPGINHFHFLFLLRISDAGYWTKFVLVLTFLGVEMKAAIQILWPAASLPE